MKNPAATSDFLAFETSLFHSKVSQKGFLAPGLCLFGDNAYVNEFYMATPFAAPEVDSYQDHYNFYHSQLRICIECAFGMLVNRWGILRKTLSVHFSIHKVVALVSCLCRIHNFLVDRDQLEDEIPDHTTYDELYMRMNNSINLIKKDDIDSQVDNDIQPLFLPNELLHVGNHSDDYDRSQIIKNDNVIP